MKSKPSCCVCHAVAGDLRNDRTSEVPGRVPPQRVVVIVRRGEFDYCIYHLPVSVAERAKPV
jgi:hypothetical protein